VEIDWSILAEKLEKTLDPGVFKVWIAPLTGEVGEDGLHLRAPNEFAAVWVRERLGTVLRETAASLLETDPAALQLTIVPASGNAHPAAPSPSTEGPALRPSREQAALPLPPPRCADHAGRPQWRFSFENFVVGPSNEMACAAARGLCADLAGAGTLFLSASAGLGKTHLIHAMGKRLSEDGEHAPCRISCLTAEEFASRYVMALKTRDVESFKAGLRRSEVLLLEDVHFLQNKERMQEEILALIKSLQAGGSRIAFTSSFTPRELRRMDGKLVSLFCSGLLAHIANPTLETRRNILQEKARLHQVVLPEPVSELLAARITGDVRRLESCLSTLVFKARLLNSLISPDMAEEIARQYADGQDGLGMDEIIRAVCAAFRFSLSQLASRSRKSELVQARSAVYYLARKHTALSLEEIGGYFNRRHSSVVKGISMMEREIRRETPLGRRLSDAVALVERGVGA
jgi:chromosomal replication initiator protein